jgi:choline dehydrogenase-like flavoprotein
MEGILLFICTGGLLSVYTKFVNKSNEYIYDVIVVGLGAHGSSSAAHLAKRGASVLGIEKFGRTHVNGSSHGKSRVIRQAYFEDPSCKCFS